MCTTSVIPIRAAGVATVQGIGFRIVCNRDEERRRVPASHPKWRAIERPGVPGARAIWPMDMEGGGTWIAAAEHGLALCLLNLNPEPPVNIRGVSGLRSRGLVIPDLIGSEDSADAMRRLERMKLRGFAPFRLVAIDARSGRLNIAEAAWDRTTLVRRWHESSAACFASSGLGDARVQCRLGLFDEILSGGEGTIADRQDEFHRHTWADRPEVSVLMSRAEARTVSIATVEAIPDGRGLWDVVMEYEPIRSDTAVEVPVGRPIGRAAGAR